MLCDVPWRRAAPRFVLADSTGHNPKDRKNALKRVAPLDLCRVGKVYSEVLNIFVKPVGDWKLVDEFVFTADRLSFWCKASHCGAEAWSSHVFKDSERFPLCISRIDCLRPK